MSTEENNNKEIQVIIPLTGNDRAAKQLSWVIRVFFCSICESYLKGAPRRVEAMAISLGMLNSAHAAGSITFDEFNDINKEISNIEDQIYPGRSIL